MKDIESVIIEKGEIAENNFRNGKSCCQAVLLAFKDECGLNEETILKIGAPFGGGTGRMRLTCGAATAIFMLAGLLKSDGSKENRNRDYELIQKLAEEFKTENGSIICAELLKGVKITSGTTPEERDDGYYKRRPCPQICRVAAKIAARNLL
ncbi:MAG: C_GCAxxG_C_C family protein [Clostridia bacterium]|nr:C_GCAxxG_C_C family protein [Clostridia bacterium]